MLPRCAGCRVVLSWPFAAWFHWWGIGLVGVLGGGGGALRCGGRGRRVLDGAYLSGGQVGEAGHGGARLAEVQEGAYRGVRRVLERGCLLVRVLVEGGDARLGVDGDFRGA